MSFWKIAWRNMWHRALASSLTGLSMALGVAAMIAVIVIYSVAVRQFTQDAQGYHLIVGGKGGKLQLVMSTVYHLGDTLYPIPYSYYQEFLPGGKFASATELAVPVCLGDSYEAPDGSLFRVVATTPDVFNKLHYGNFPDGRPKVYGFQAGGRNFEREHFFEAVVGSVVARRSGLKLGDEIHPTHGIGSSGHKHEGFHEGFQVVGILQPTGTANDRAVFINIEGFYLLEGHASHGAEAGPNGTTAEAQSQTSSVNKTALDDAHADHDSAVDEHAIQEHAEHDDDHDHEQHVPLPIDQREVTSILVLANSELSAMALDSMINKADDGIAQAVSPSREVTQLLDRIVGPVQVVLLAMTVLIVIVAGVSILVSIYNSMSERRHDIAVMRALGASRGAVMGIILFESILLSLGGGLLGVLLGHAAIGLANPYVVDATGVTLNALQFDWQELVLIPGLILLASLVGLLPAVSAYRTDVAKALAGSR